MTEQRAESEKRTNRAKKIKESSHTYTVKSTNKARSKSRHKRANQKEG